MEACRVAVLLVTVLALAVGGCTRPRLASRPLTEEQKEWSSIIRASYPGWRPPYYSTAVNRGPALASVSPARVVALPPVVLSEPAAPAREVEFVPADSAR